MSNPQILIDSEILRRYVLGNEQDREVLDKVYGGILPQIRQELINSLFVEEINKQIKVKKPVEKFYPVMYQNKGFMVKITVTEDKLELT